MKDDGKIVTRREFISSTVGTAGLLGVAGLSPGAWASEDAEKSIEDVLYPDKSIPYIGMTEDGPLYPPLEIPWLGDLTNTQGTKAVGQTLYLFGRILDRKGRPLDNATVEIWQTDYNGNYRHPRGWNQDKLDPNFGYFGKVRTNSEGFYLFKTIRPRWYSLFGMSRAAHIHLKMRHMDHGVLTTEAYFENASHEETAPKDRIFLSRPKWVRDRIVLPQESPDKYRDLQIELEPGALCCKYDLAFLL